MPSDLILILPIAQPKPTFSPDSRLISSFFSQRKQASFNGAIRSWPKAYSFFRKGNRPVSMVQYARGRRRLTLLLQMPSDLILILPIAQPKPTFSHDSRLISSFFSQRKSAGFNGAMRSWPKAYEFAT